jgi:hypothetical protein
VAVGFNRVVEVAAVGTHRVVARSVISLRVQALAATLTVEHGGTPLPTMLSQTGHMFKGETNTAVVDEVEGTTDTHLHGKTRVKVACAPFTALRVVATRVTIAHFCTSREGLCAHNAVVQSTPARQRTTLQPNLCMSYACRMEEVVWASHQVERVNASSLTSKTL